MKAAPAKTLDTPQSVAVQEHTPKDSSLSRPSVYGRRLVTVLCWCRRRRIWFGSLRKGGTIRTARQAVSVVARHPGRDHSSQAASWRAILGLQTTSRRWIRVCRPVFHGRECSVTVTPGWAQAKINKCHSSGNETFLDDIEENESSGVSFSPCQRRMEGRLRLR